LIDAVPGDQPVGTFENELIRRQSPWRDIDHVGVETLQWVHWFNTDRPHEALADLTPEKVEELHFDRNSTLPIAG